MKITETIQTRKNSFSLLSGGLLAMALFMGILISLFPSHREYSPLTALSKDKDEDAGAKGEADFFFNARKDISTNKMNYQSMLAADIADRAMITNRNTHSASVSAVPSFNWLSMGPNNVGGRTRAILIDNTDATHQTIFAGGVSGGIWKSTNGGATWDNAESAIAYSLNDTLSNINVDCIAQDANGAIYIGTGEGFSDYEGGDGFSSAILGGGIFKSTDDGKTWRLLPKTAPSAANNSSIAWAFVNRIAIRPDSFQVIYAATNEGLMVSHDSGTTWVYAVNSLNHLKITQNSLDVKVSNDGNIVVACSNDEGFYCYPKTGNSNVFTVMGAPGPGKGGFSRIEFAISPTNSNRIYASVITSSNGQDPFQASALSGIYMTINAVSSGNGGRWNDIGSGGSLSFDPYAEPGGSSDQANYDNALGVPPANEAQVLCGGTTLWEWSGSSLTDTIGSWEKVSHYQPYYLGDQHWIHADEHAIVFDLNNPQTVFVGCDGGIFKSTNFYLNPSNVNGNGTGSISSLSFEPINRNYNVTQYYSISFTPLTDTAKVPISINNGTAVDTIIEHLGQGGGTQDNGSPYINGSYSNKHPNDAVDLSGGDGAGSVVSVLNPNIAYFCSDYGALEREGNLGTLSTPTSAYTQNKGKNAGGNIDSVWQKAAAIGNVCFVFPVALYENSYDLLNVDSVLFINTTDSNYHSGNTIWPNSAIGGLTYPYLLPKNLNSGDTLKVPDRVVSRLAIGFSPSFGGIWINGQASSSNTVIWMPIAGSLSKPDAYTSSSGDAIHSITWTPDGNTLFAGTQNGVFFRFSNINSIVANSYRTGALWSNTPGGIFDTTNQVVSTSLNSALGATGRDILSISVDPANGNNVMVTLGNYNNTKYVLYSSNALGATPTFTSVQGNLPAMPVYSSILDIMDSTGHYITNSAMVATEHGIYTTTNITLGASTKWVKNNNGMANCLTLAIKQQTAKAWLCNNEGVIYAGTHGRGIWSSNNTFEAPTGVKDVTAISATSSLSVYPNPMTTRGNIQFNLSNADAVTITIYDMQGNQVKTMNMGTQAPGSHTVTFESDGFREGTYFATLTGSNFRKVSKFIVMH